MTKLVLAFASLIAVSALVHAQETGVQFSGQSFQYSRESSTLHCTKCVMTLSKETKVQVTAQEVTGNSATGAVTFLGVVRLMLADGEVVAQGGTFTTDLNGVQRFSSDEMQFVSASIR